MGAHGNTPRAADVNTRGEATNAALAGRVGGNGGGSGGGAGGKYAGPVTEEEREVAALLRARVPELEGSRDRAYAAFKAAQAREAEARQVTIALSREEAQMRKAEPTRPEVGPPPPEWRVWQAQYDGLQQRLDAAEQRMTDLARETRSRQHWHTAAQSALDHVQMRADRLVDPASHVYARLDPSAIAGARTLSDVEGWLREAFPHVRVHLTGADLTHAIAAAQELATLAREHPYAMQELAYFGSAHDPAFAAEVAASESLARDPGVTSNGRALAETAGVYHQRAHGILLTNLALENSDRVREVWQFQHDIRWDANQSHAHPAAYVTRHEFGHHVERFLMQPPHDRHGPPRTRTQEALYRYLLNHRSDAYVSGYARHDDDPREAFAEAYAAARYGDQAQRENTYTKQVASSTEVFA